MTIRTAAQLRKNLETIKKDNEARLEKIRNRIDEFESRGGNTDLLKRELTQARNAAEASERLAEKALKTAEERELKQAQEVEETRTRVSSEIEARQRFRAERAWIAAGGDPKAFETHWPTMREELLKQAVLQGSNTPEANRTSVQSL